MIETLYQTAIEFPIMYRKYFVELLLYREDGLRNLQIAIFVKTGFLSAVKRSLADILERDLWPEFLTKLRERLDPKWVEPIFEELTRQLKPHYLPANSNKLLLFQVYQALKDTPQVHAFFHERFDDYFTLKTLKAHLIELYEAYEAALTRGWEITPKVKRNMRLIFAQTYLREAARKPIEHGFHERFLVETERKKWLRQQ